MQSIVELRLLARLGSPQVIFDVGSRDDIDYYCCYPNSIIHMFEPNKKHFDSLVEKLKRHNAYKVHCHQIGLSDKAEIAARYYKNTESFVLHWQGISQDSGEKFDLTTLDEFVEENQIDRIDFLKTDCEQMDHLVIDGGRRSINRLDIPFIQCECSDIDKLLALLPAYDAYIIIDEVLYDAISSNPEIVLDFDYSKSLLRCTDEVREAFKTLVFVKGYGCNLFFVKNGYDISRFIFDVKTNQ